MPKPIPFPTKPKDAPVGREEVPETPIESEQLDIQPEETPQVEVKPDETPKVETTPEETPKVEETPDETPPKVEMPLDVNEENCVTVNGKLIELKPTKVRYFRNQTASTYNILKTIPLSELLTINKGIIDERRDGDQILYDYLVAAFDDSEFVRDNYDNLDADQVERVIKITGRLNHIEEKIEAQRKNREAQANR